MNKEKRDNQKTDSEIETTNCGCQKGVGWGWGWAKYGSWNKIILSMVNTE